MLNLRLPLAVASVPLLVTVPSHAALHEAPPIERVVRVVHAESGAEVSLDALVEKLQAADVVFLGETHLDETTHRLEAEIYRRLIAARDGKVVLALEMFERDEQPALDRYLAGEIDESTFLAEVNEWPNYQSGYRRLIELAKANGLPVVASNAPVSLRRKLAMGGADAWNGLSEEERAFAPAELHDNTDAYWERVGNAMRSHRHFLPGEGARVYSTQSLWDNSMGDACARALSERPGWMVLHVNGGFHSGRRDGTVRQLLLRKPDAKVLTVGIQPVDVAHAEDPTRWPAVADYLAFATSLAADVNEGRHSVRVGRDLHYRLHVPKSASVTSTVPLVIVLPDDGLPSADVLGLWRDRLGDEAAIAVVEPPHRQRQDDLSIGGLWFWPDELDDELSGVVSGIDAVWGYLARNYPIDRDRVLLTGEGTGATLAVAAAVRADRFGGRVLAFRPSRFKGLKELPLPLPEDRVEPVAKRALVVYTAEADKGFWDKEAGEYVEVGFDVSVAGATTDPWRRDHAQLTQIRDGLGLDATAEPEGRAHIVLDHATPLARLWARRLAARASKSDSPRLVAVMTADEAAGVRARLDGSTALPATGDANMFSDGKSLPKAPGPFGGTTLVVLHDGLDADERARWAELVAGDVLNKTSRFHRLRAATLAGDDGIDAMLTKLASEGRRNVLLVPASFAAPPNVMAAIRKAARKHEGDMTLHYRPGLGGAVATAQ